MCQSSVSYNQTSSKQPAVENCLFLLFFTILRSTGILTSERGERVNEDRRPKNEEPFKVGVKSLDNGSNIILDREH